MEKILLVEPNYKNKYPPLGLMKISTFHKEYKKDYVKFVKGNKTEKEISTLWDRIYITTLFTFDYDEVIKTINHYKNFVKNWEKDIVIGGVLATLLPDKIEEETGIVPFKGQVTAASQINYTEEKYRNINIDILTLDYDILSEIDYEYPAGDNYFGYTSRGCVRKCDFCAVPILEPKFETTNNIEKQINEIKTKYGEKRNLLLMDNNILHSPDLDKIVDSLTNLGFYRENKTYEKPVEYENIYNRIQRRKKTKIDLYKDVIERDIEKAIYTLQELGKKKRYQYLVEIIKNLEESPDFDSRLLKLEDCYEDVSEFLNKKRNKRKLERVVDFNQGTDARLLTEDKMKLLSKIDVKPYRIAFDDINLKGIYEKAIRLAYKYGVRTFSNYILFNFRDTPQEFWERIKFNIDLSEELGVKDMFSFPMKYSPIQDTNRKYIGEEWTKKEVSNIYAILNAQMGIVPKKKSYFEIAFGKTIDDFNKLLFYPRDFLIFRNYFTEIGFTGKWKELFDSLSKDEKEELRLVKGKEYLGENKTIKQIISIENFSKNKTDYIQQLLFPNKPINKEKFFNITLEISDKRISFKKEIKLYLEEKKYI